jgi:hypothetical protein
MPDPYEPTRTPPLIPGAPEPTRAAPAPPAPGDVTQAQDGPPASPAPPTRLPQLPRYDVQGELGRGGMGVVYKAHDRRLNRPVAIKMILGGVAAGSGAATRFLEEAHALAALNHPHVIGVFDFGEHQGLPYFVMEFCPGGSLRAKAKDRPLPAREAAVLVEQLARGVQAAHARNLLHRDLKPDNVLFAADGTPRITDFGLAKRFDDPEPGNGVGLTAPGAVLGSPSYMAPEQAEGDSKRVGPATDVYALGAILYELLTGRPPFRGSTFRETLDQVRSAAVVRPSRLRPEVPPGLETVCLRCLEKEPGRRYPTAEALADDLGTWLRDDNRTPAAPPGPARLVRRRPVSGRVALAAGAGAVLIAGIAYAIWPKGGSTGGGTANEGVPPTALSDRVQSLPAAPVLKVVFEGAPPAAAAGERPRLRVGLYARRAGEPGYRPLADAAPLASRVDRYWLGVQPLTDGYLYVFQVDARGQADWLFPANKRTYSSGANPVRAGHPVQVPSADRHAFYLDANTGAEHLYIVFGAARWPALEDALARSGPEDLPVPAAYPDDGRLAATDRGVGGVAHDDPPLPFERVAEKEAFNLPAVTFEGTHSFLVVERWFRHVPGP